MLYFFHYGIENTTFFKVVTKLSESKTLLRYIYETSPNENN